MLARVVLEVIQETLLAAAEPFGVKWLLTKWFFALTAARLSESP